MGRAASPQQSVSLVSRLLPPFIIPSVSLSFLALLLRSPLKYITFYFTLLLLLSSSFSSLRPRFRLALPCLPSISPLLPFSACPFPFARIFFYFSAIIPLFFLPSFPLLQGNCVVGHKRPKRALDPDIHPFLPPMAHNFI